MNNPDEGVTKKIEPRAAPGMDVVKGLLVCMVASTIFLDSTGSLAFIGKILYKIQPDRFHIVLIYDRGIEPQTILFYHPDEVQCHMYLVCKEYW